LHNVLSSLAIAWLTALDVRQSSSAAARKDPVLAAASKILIEEIGMFGSMASVNQIQQLVTTRHLSKDASKA
jgi:hypothetical protein